MFCEDGLPTYMYRIICSFTSSTFAVDLVMLTATNSGVRFLVDGERQTDRVMLAANAEKTK